MITLRRTASVPAKNVGTALAWAREVTAYGKSKFGVDSVLQMPIGGNPWRISFVQQFENLAAMEKSQQNMMSDQKFMEMLAKSSDIYSVGSAVDEVWTNV